VQQSPYEGTSRLYKFNDVKAPSVRPWTARFPLKMDNSYVW
jgi:hypothetical protein